MRGVGPLFQKYDLRLLFDFFFFFHGHFHKHKGDNVSKSLKQQEVLVIMRVMKTRERERERESTIMADIFVDCGGLVFESEREREYGREMKARVLLLSLQFQGSLSFLFFFSSL